MSQGYLLTKLLGSIEERPSPIHGKGIFATASIQPGEYNTLPTDPKLMKVMEKFANLNSALMPNWKDILLAGFNSHGNEGGNSTDIHVGSSSNSISEENANQFVQRLAKFRKGIAGFINEEQSKANIQTSTSSGNKADLICNVLRELKEGEELLRSYGSEWLIIKYYNLKSNELECKKSDKDLIISVDVDSLHPTLWDNKGPRRDIESNANSAKMGKLLSKKEGKELIVISLQELNTLSNIVGMIALEYYDLGDKNYDFTWQDNLRGLRRHFSKEVIHPASFSSAMIEKTAKKRSKKRKQEGGGEVEKLKHGAFDVYKLKK